MPAKKTEKDVVVIPPQWPYAERYGCRYIREYRGYVILTKQDWEGNGFYRADIRTTSKVGFVVVERESGSNPMPGAMWFGTIPEAEEAIDFFIFAKCDADEWHGLMAEAAYLRRKAVNRFMPEDKQLYKTDLIVVDPDNMGQVLVKMPALNKKWATEMSFTIPKYRFKRYQRTSIAAGARFTCFANIASERHSDLIFGEIAIASGKPHANI